MDEFLKVADWSQLKDRQPAYALAGDVDLVVIRYDDQVSVLLPFLRCSQLGLSNRHWRFRIQQCRGPA